MHVILQPSRVQATVNELTELLRLYDFVTTVRHPLETPNFAKDFPNLTYIFAAMIADNHFLQYKAREIEELYTQAGHKVKHG